MLYLALALVAILAARRVVRWRRQQQRRVRIARRLGGLVAAA
ncbi:MAG TPA: hypothetical protein VNN07_02150 [Candidatus Tectomicrobia bacterium]|nr:hypothetical protein [Candidatus Tectomicrobia bacterium]